MKELVKQNERWWTIRHLGCLPVLCVSLPCGKNLSSSVFPPKITCGEIPCVLPTIFCVLLKMVLSERTPLDLSFLFFSFFFLSFLLVRKPCSLISVWLPSNSLLLRVSSPCSACPSALLAHSSLPDSTISSFPETLKEALAGIPGSKCFLPGIQPTIFQGSLT